MNAIISDVHSNIEALTAVMEDIHSQDISDTLCLGDVVGYGPDPEACIDIIDGVCRFCLSGNHDYAVLTEAERFNPLAEEAVEATRERLKPGLLKGDWYRFGKSRTRARWQFLERLFLDKRERDILYVHGSPLDPRNEYILETDLVFGNIDKIEEILAVIPRFCFVGHTHVPGIITEEFQFLHPVDFHLTMRFEPDQKYIVNVGSVGQPRDGDNRACYVVMDNDTITYRRVKYDFHKTMSKMQSLGPLSAQHAERLEQGR